ncbi:MAG: hypothetical protein WC884_04020 [Candidatus Paceibacterota bacterium]
MEIKYKEEECEIIKIIMKYFLIEDCKAEILWSLWKAGGNDPVLSTYKACKELHELKLLKTYDSR